MIDIDTLVAPAPAPTPVNVNIALVRATAARWAASNPDLEARIWRAVRLVESGAVTRSARSTNVFWVASTTHEGGRHKVEARPRWCSCPDHSERKGARCKHTLAAALVEVAEVRG
jgi:hypothetical protein